MKPDHSGAWQLIIEEAGDGSLLPFDPIFLNLVKHCLSDLTAMH